MLEIILDNRDGHLWDVSGIISDATYKTSRKGSASTFEFTLIKGGWYEDKDFKYNVGDIVRVRKDGVKVFYGYIFVISSGRDEEVKITAYDQMRYLMVNDYLLKSDMTATEVVQHFADKYQLKTGTLIDTEYKIPKISEDGVKTMDIICKAMDNTLLGTGKQFLLLDDFGELVIQNVEDRVLNLSLGDGSLLYDYKQKVTIENSYNMVVLGRDNKELGKRELFIKQDSSNIAKWGLLMLYQSVDEKMDDDQVKKSLANLMNLKNRVGRSFQVEAIGDIRVRAGSYLSINIAEEGINMRFLVNECTHKFEGSDHSMSLDLFDIRMDDSKVVIEK